MIPVTRIPKTTSGKVQRAMLANQYADGDYDEIVAQLGRGGRALVGLGRGETTLALLSPEAGIGMLAGSLAWLRWPRVV